MGRAYLIHVDPGAHDLTLDTHISHGFVDYRHSKWPIIRVNVEAGQVYQIEARQVDTTSGLLFSRDPGSAMSAG